MKTTSQSDIISMDAGGSNLPLNKFSDWFMRSRELSKKIKVGSRKFQALVSYFFHRYLIVSVLRLVISSYVFFWRAQYLGSCYLPVCDISRGEMSTVERVNMN